MPAPLTPTNLTHSPLLRPTTQWGRDTLLQLKGTHLERFRASGPTWDQWLSPDILSRVMSGIQHIPGSSMLVLQDLVEEDREGHQRGEAYGDDGGGEEERERITEPVIKSNLAVALDHCSVCTCTYFRI